MPMLPWIAVSAALLAVIAALLWRLTGRKPAPPAELPAEWTLSARPVFSTEERHVYRLLREALPHHIILSKLPLVRFCQPTDPNEVRYWYQLLGASHVGFAVCSANGRVLAAIDLDSERGNSTRLMQIKQAVLAACRVRYLRCAAEHLPSIAELQLLVPQHNAPPRGPQPAPTPIHDFHEARSFLASTVAARRSERTALWQDSTLFHDSFFAPDTRPEGPASDYGSLGVSNGRPLLSDDPEQDPGALSAAGLLRGAPRPLPPHPSSPTRH